MQNNDELDKMIKVIKCFAFGLFLDVESRKSYSFAQRRRVVISLIIDRFLVIAI